MDTFRTSLNVKHVVPFSSMSYGDPGHLGDSEREREKFEQSLSVILPYPSLP